MENSVAIDVSIVFHNGEQAGIPLDYVTLALKELDSVVYAQEMEDFKLVKKYLVEYFSPIVLDAVENRLRENRGKSVVRLLAIQPGSVELTIALGGLFIWLLEKTIGETISESWKKTRMHEAIRDLLARTREKKAKDIGRICSEKINKKLGEEANAHIVLVDPIGGPGKHRYKINIDITVTSLQDYPPPRETLFDDIA